MKELYDHEALGCELADPDLWERFELEIPLASRQHRMHAPEFVTWKIAQDCDSMTRPRSRQKHSPCSSAVSVAALPVGPDECFLACEPLAYLISLSCMNLLWNGFGTDFNPVLFAYSVVLQDCQLLSGG